MIAFLLLAVLEVDTFKYFVHFMWQGKEKMTLHKFRKKLALALIYNEQVLEELGKGKSQTKRKKRRVFDVREHLFMMAPIRACKYAPNPGLSVYGEKRNARNHKFACKGGDSFDSTKEEYRSISTVC